MVQELEKKERKKNTERLYVQDEDDEEFSKLNDELRTSVPFAVVGSNTVHEVKGKKVWSVNDKGKSLGTRGRIKWSDFWGLIL